MSLSDKFFGEQDNTPSEGNKEHLPQNNFITNSSEFGFGSIEIGISGRIQVDGILAIAAFDKLSQAVEVDFEYKVMYTSLLDEGALTVPVVFTFDNKKYSLYFIYQEEDLLKYQDLVKQVDNTSYPNLIYFSALPIYNSQKSKPVVEPFQLADLRYDKEAIIAGEYAMWWQTPEELTFHNSATFDYLCKIYDAFKGYETYFHGYLLRQTGIMEETKLQRIELPKDHVKYVLQAPEDKKIFLDISQEKGIRFLFPVITTSREYRERFLRGVLTDLLATRFSLQQQKLPVDEELLRNSYDWFQYIIQAVTQKETAGDQIELIGGIRANVNMN